MKNILLRIAAGAGWQEEMIIVTITGCVWFLWVLLVIGGTILLSWVKRSWVGKKEELV
jgi:hypothetical protein